MYRYLLALRPAGSTQRKRRSAKAIPFVTGPLDRLSPQRTTRIFLQTFRDLSETEQQDLTQIRHVNPHLATAYQLVQDFMEMVREQRGHLLDRWLKAVEESGLPELRSFASGIRQDKAAVLAELTQSWNNGPIEEHVNRLKLIKRSMYGRAKFELLRQRVLKSARPDSEGKKTTHMMHPVATANHPTSTVVHCERTSYPKKDAREEC